MDLQKFDLAFETLLSELETIEKSSKKHFSQIRKAAFSPELAKALHEEQTGINDHTKRLKLIAIEQQIKKKAGTTTIKSTSLSNYGRKKEASRDLLMIAHAQQLLQQKQAYYRILYKIAVHLNLEHTPILLQQTSEENEATLTWLDKIIQRTLTGETIIPL